MTYLPDLYTKNQIPSDGDALTVRVVLPVPAMSSFGTLVTGPETTVVQLQFPYGMLRERLNVSSSMGGYISSSMGMAIVNSGTGSLAYASFESKAANRYVAGTGGRFKFAGYFVSGGRDQSTQEVGVGDDQDGFFFGYSGSQFGVNRRARGVDNWTPAASWSLDHMDGTGPSKQVLNPTYGNVYMIMYQWLGFGAITYHVEDGETGMFCPVHRIGYANQHLVPSVADPNLPIRVAVRNWGSTGSIAINVSSLAAMIEGQEPPHGLRRGDNAVATGVSDEVPLMTIMNSGSFNGRTNRMRLRFEFISAASRDINAATSYRLVKNATLTGAAFVPVSASNSPANIDKSATSFTGGRESLIISLGPNGHQMVDLIHHTMRLDPGDIMTVTGSGSNSTCHVGLTWIEEI